MTGAELPKSIVVPECPEHGVGGGVKFCWCNQPMVERRYVPAEVTDEMVDAAVRAFNGWPADHPMDEYHRRDVRWVGMRRALVAAFSTQQNGEVDV